MLRRAPKTVLACCTQQVQLCRVDVYRLELESAPPPPPAAIVVVDDDPSCSPVKKRSVMDEESAASTTSANKQSETATTNNASLYVSSCQDSCGNEDRVCYNRWRLSKSN